MATESITKSKTQNSEPRTWIIGANRENETLEKVCANLQRKKLSIKENVRSLRDSLDITEYVATEVRKDPNATGLLLVYGDIAATIAANKVPGIRAARCINAYDATIARRQYDANVLVLTAGSTCLTEEIIDSWANIQFDRTNPVNLRWLHEVHYLEQTGKNNEKKRRDGKIDEIVLGSDGFSILPKMLLREVLLNERRFRVKDKGYWEHYLSNDEIPVTTAVSEELASSPGKRGIMVVRLGLGESIGANKCNGVYAARCVTPTDAQDAVGTCNANLIIIPTELHFRYGAKEIALEALSTEAKQEGPICKRIQRIETKYLTNS